MKSKIKNTFMAMLFMRLCTTTMKSLTSKALMRKLSSANPRSSFNKLMSISLHTFICHSSHNYSRIIRTSCRSVAQMRQNLLLRQLQTSKYLTVVKISGLRLQILTIDINILVLSFTWIEIWYR